jgi:hypothetical protein
MKIWKGAVITLLYHAGNSATLSMHLIYVYPFKRINFTDWFTIWLLWSDNVLLLLNLEHHEGRKREEIRVVQLGGSPIPEIAILRITNTWCNRSAKKCSPLCQKFILYSVKTNKSSLNEYHYSQNTMLGLPKSYLAGPLGPTSECGIRGGARAAEGTWWYNATLGNVTIWLQASNNSANHPTLTKHTSPIPHKATCIKLQYVYFKVVEFRKSLHL